MGDFRKNYEKFSTLVHLNSIILCRTSYLLNQAQCTQAVNATQMRTPNAVFVDQQTHSRVAILITGPCTQVTLHAAPSEGIMELFFLTYLPIYCKHRCNV